ncbi:tyrosine-type recombinase/integrase [Chloroflexota bacterium]
MRGHIRKRGKNSWAIVMEIGRDATTGRRRQQWQTIQGNKKDAEKLLSNMLHSQDKGIFVKPTRTTIGEFLEQWLKDYVKTNTAPRTRERYIQIIRSHLIPSLGNIPLTQLRPDLIQSYYASELNNGRLDGKGGLSATTVLHHHRVLSEALNHAVKWGLVVRNVAQAVDPPRTTRKEMNTLAPEDIPVLFEEAKQVEYSSGLPYFTMILTAFHTGMRRGEFMGLKWRDIDFNQVTISVSRSLQSTGDDGYIFREPKTQKARRLIAMTPTLAVELRKHKNAQEMQRSVIGSPLTEDDLVFSNPDGRPINPNTVSPTFTKLARRVGLKLRLHDLRHSHASLMLKAGIHPKIVSERLGHATVALTLDTYSHIMPGLQEAAAKAFDENLPRIASHRSLPQPV